MSNDYEIWMEAALLEAERASVDVPVGCVIANPSGAVVCRKSNSREVSRNLIGHAEANAVLALWGSPEHGDLKGFTLVSTLEPCLMCEAMLRETGTSTVVFGAHNPQRGAAGSVYDLLRDKRLGPPIEVIGGKMAESCQLLLDGFFQQVRSRQV